MFLPRLLLLVCALALAESTRLSEVNFKKIPYYALETDKRFVVATSLKVNWFKAVRVCALNGMRLASLHSPNDKQQLVRFIRDKGLSVDLWLSGTDMRNHKKFYWFTTGLPLTIKWGPGQPDFKDKYAHCTALTKDKHALINKYCYETHQFVCEKNI